MTENTKEVLKKKIASALQKIQDNTVLGTKGLDRIEVKEHIVFWELGILLKEFVDLESFHPEKIHEDLQINFRKIEKKIRSEGIRKEKSPLPSWEYKNQTVKPPRIQEPSITWVLVSWDFVTEYQDLERWNLVANLSGAMFEEGFVRKRAEDLIPYFSKASPIPNATVLQDKFINEISKFKKNPTRKEFGSDGGSEGLIPLIFGKSKININLGREYFLSIQSDVNRLLDEETGNEELRNAFAKSIGVDQIDSLRRLLRLISITDEQKFQKRLEQLGKQISKTLKTKHIESKELYGILYSLIKDDNSRKKFLHRVSRHDLTILNTKLSGVATPQGFLEYQENQKSREELFT